jgi:hypothetical protein
MMTEFTVDDIRSLLTELGRRLESRGLFSTIYVVGGAAMALVYDRRRVTDDIDAVFDQADAVMEIAEEMASDRGIQPDWLNSSVRQFLPGPPSDDREATTYEVPGLSISRASPRHLLAMKMAAYRPQDQRDLVTLFDTLGIADPVEAVDITFAVYGDEYLDLAGGRGGREEYLLRASTVMARLQATRGAPRSEIGGAASSRCGRCGQPLGSAESTARGMDPGCAQK